MSDISFTAPDFSGGPMQFLSQARSELKKVIWPTRQELLKLTAIVLVVSLIVGIYIGALDYGFTKITALVIRK